MRAIHTLLTSFHVLHQRGYEGLKIYTEVYETGHWRCSVGVIGQPRAAFGDAYRYTSADSWDYLASLNQPQRTNADIRSEQLADLFESQLPELLHSCRFACRPYTVWYELLLRACGSNGYFVLQDSASGFDAWRTGYVRIRQGSGHDDRFPLAPVF